ncbi:ATP-binding protein [Umezawaea sp. Da 62-37]|uniref:ATP-binding protein n=1 Tax=Umezawaea sp. Da 62-37 TaxID=3075927 RepID=UPI0028F6E361|nr:ATP-binding protein [Umezawaea sp. Da 62-37]WNV87410.1 ATP-binding protein [Umezawaea sp. Da 62-37]
MTGVVRGTETAAQVSRLPLEGEPDRQVVRRWIRGVCSARLDVHTLVDVLLVTTELVDNAYRHTSCPVDLRIACTDFGVLIEVSDGDKAHPAEMANANRTWGSRGVQVMVELAISWGVRVDGTGKTVWALLPMVEPKVTPRSG